MWSRPFHIKLRKIFQRRIDQRLDVGHAILTPIVVYIVPNTLFIFLRIKVVLTLRPKLGG